MLTAMFIIAILIEIGLPFFLAILLTRRFGTSWKLVGIGALIFIGSQVVHIPLLKLLTYLFTSGTLPTPSAQYIPLFNAVLLGLMAGLCEETARWVGFKLLKQRGNSLEAALTLGVGHGGVESLIIGLVVLYNFVLMALLRTGAVDINVFPAETGTALLAQARSFWEIAWHLPLAGGVERISTMVLHVVLTVLVWRTIATRSLVFYGLAVALHTIVDGMAVLMTSYSYTTWSIEGVLLIIMAVNLGLLYYFYRRHASRLAQAQPEALPPAA